MEIIRRLSALLIAVSLVLPQRSCVSQGQTEIHYPLSGADSALVIAVIVALYTLPLIVLLFSRFRISSLIAGIAAISAGLYYIAYDVAQFADTLLSGWYAYTIGAMVYFFTSLAQLKRAFIARKAGTDRLGKSAEQPPFVDSRPGS